MPQQQRQQRTGAAAAAAAAASSTRSESGLLTVLSLRPSDDQSVSAPVKRARAELGLHPTCWGLRDAGAKPRNAGSTQQQTANVCCCSGSSKLMGRGAPPSVSEHSAHSDQVGPVISLGIQGLRELGVEAEGWLHTSNAQQGSGAEGPAGCSPDSGRRCGNRITPCASRKACAACSAVIKWCQQLHGASCCIC